MTTTDDDPYDSKLAGLLQENQTEWHVFAPMVKTVTTREGVIGGGPELTTQLNSHGTTTMSVILPCPAHEAILFGSVEISATLSAKHTINTTAWQTGATNTDNYIGISSATDTTACPLPKFALNSQFAYVDLKIGTSQGSVNATLPGLQGSTGGTGILAAFNVFANVPQEGGVYEQYKNDRFDTQARSFAKQDDSFSVSETIYHPLNPQGQSLLSEDFDDNHVLRIWPRGMSIQLTLTSRQFQDRAYLTEKITKIKKGSTDETSTTGALYLNFAEAKIWFKTVTVMPIHLEIEQPVTRFAVLDMSVDVTELTAGQKEVSLQVTRTETAVLPQYVLVMVSSANMHLTRNLPHTDDLRTVVVNALAAVSANFQGNNIPSFMRIYNDGKVTFANKRQMSDMRNAWLGRISGFKTRSRGLGQPRLEVQLINLAASTVGNAQVPQSGFQMFLLVTDPNSTLVREASGAVHIGRLDLTVTLAAAATAGQCVYMVRFTKHHVQMIKTLEVPGTAPQYELDTKASRQAFTQTVSLPTYGAFAGPGVPQPASQDDVYGVPME